MSASARTNWFWSDWLGDQAVRRLTPAERGVWIDLLALMAAAAPAGYLCDSKGRPLSGAELGRICNCSAEDMATYITGILDKGAASRDRTGRLFNRRMVREAEVSAKKSRAGKKGAYATRLKWQGFLGLPQQLPGHVPRQTSSSPIQLSKLTTTTRAAAKRLSEEESAPAAATREMLEELFEARKRREG